MTVDEVLAEAGITRDDPEWSSQWNLCYAAMKGGIGIRHGSRESVKDVLTKHNLAPIVLADVEKFYRCLERCISVLSQ